MGHSRCYGKTGRGYWIKDLLEPISDSSTRGPTIYFRNSRTQPGSTGYYFSRRTRGTRALPKRGKNGGIGSWVGWGRACKRRIASWTGSTTV